MTALEVGVDTLLAAEPWAAWPRCGPSRCSSRLFIAQVRERCAAHALPLASPEDEALRGSQVSLACNEGGYAVMAALIARGVIGDFRAGQGTAEAPDLLRFGFTPLYTRFVDVFDAVTALAAVLDSGEWREARFNQRAAVT
jgi:kynureninase